MPPPLASPSKITHFCGLAWSAGVELAQHVGRDRHGLPEHDLADVDGHVLGRVHRLREPRRGRREAAFALLAVAVELQMGEMQRQALRRRDGRERGLDVAGDAEIVAMDVQRMRHAELVDGALQRLDDGARGDAVERHDVVERECTHVGLEGDGAAGIDHLDAERARRCQRPGHVVANGGRALARRASGRAGNRRCRAPTTSPCR